MKEIRSFLCDKRPDLFDYIASRDIAQKDNCVILQYMQQHYCPLHMQYQYLLQQLARLR